MHDVNFIDSCMSISLLEGSLIADAIPYLDQGLNTNINFSMLLIEYGLD